MYKINLYRDRNGNEPVSEYLSELRRDSNKGSKQISKIRDYIKLLGDYGTYLGEPYVKKIGNDLWELRPGDNRIFFFTKSARGYVLLHAFKKKTQKTPKLEIKRAEREIKYIKEVDEDE